MRRFLWLSLGVLLLACVAVASSGGATQVEARWVITDLGTLGGAESYAAAINARGRVVGWAETKKGRKHPFLWQGGRMRDLGALGYKHAWATGLNDRDQVIGRVLTVGGDEDFGVETAPRAFTWVRSAATELWGDHDHFADEAAYSSVEAINEDGQMVGWADDPGDQGSHAFLWRVADGRRDDVSLGTDLGPVATPSTKWSGVWSAAYDINDRGQVVGEVQRYYNLRSPFRAVLWEDAKLTELGTLPGRTESSAVAVNDPGQIVGRSFDLVGEYRSRVARMRAFLWQGGEMIDLGALPGLRNSSAVALNESGQVIGWSAKALGEDEGLPKNPRAFVWEGGSLTDLGALGGASSDPFAINEVGQIVGQSQKKNGQWHAFVWQSGRMRALPTLGGRFSAALAINDAGQIVGWSRTRKDVKHAVLWTLKR